MRIFLAGLFVGVSALMTPLVASAADTVLVIGDSIAQGTASVLSPTKTVAVVGANSRTIAGFDGSGAFTQMVVSTGSNDKGQNFTAAQQQSYLRAIRDKQPNAKTVWILPYDAAMKAAVRSVAASYGDTTVDLSQFPSADGLHPRSYSSLAAAVRTSLGSTAAATQGAQSTNTPGGAANNSNVGNVAAPTSSFLGLVPCGDASTPCTLCHFITGIANLITTIRDVMFFIGLAVITGMAIIYIVSGGNEKLMTVAKNGIKYTLIGIFFVLFAWLIVNTVIFTIFNAKQDLGVGATLTTGGGFQFSCDASTRSGQLVGSTTYRPGGTTATPGVSGVPGGATSTASGCQPLLNGWCSVSNLNKYFGQYAERMSRICNYESRNNPANESGSDRCTDGRAFSIGLFQINLTVNDLNRGCTKAFEGRNYSCRVIDLPLYQSCVAAAKNPDINIAYAATLSKNGAVISPWQNTVRTCGIK